MQNYPNPLDVGATLLCTLSQRLKWLPYVEINNFFLHSEKYHDDENDDKF